MPVQVAAFAHSNCFWLHMYSTCMQAVKELVNGYVSHVDKLLRAGLDLRSLASG